MNVEAIRERNHPSSPIQNSPVMDRLADAGMAGFKFARKAANVLKKASYIVDAYAQVPVPLSETLLAFKAFKIIKGCLAIPELFSSTKKVIKADNAEDRFYASWNIVKCVKKIIGAVETVFLYLSKLNVISHAATAWTAITGYIFMPVSIISAGISGYECGAKATFMNTFRAELKAKKLAGKDTPSAIATRTCKHILAQRAKLKKFEVITKDCPLNKRLTNILKMLKSSNLETRLKAAKQGLHIKKCLKHRLSEQVGVAAVGASIATAGVAASIVGLACPPAAPPLAIVGAVLTGVGIANFIYTKCIPQGDILDTENKMLFASIRKGVKTTCNAVQNLAQKLTTTLSPQQLAAPAA